MPQLNRNASSRFVVGAGKRFCIPQILLAQAAGHVEPFAYHIINRWFDEYFLRAVARTRQPPCPLPPCPQP